MIMISVRLPLPQIKAALHGLAGEVLLSAGVWCDNVVVLRLFVLVLCLEFHVPALRIFVLKST